MALLPQIKSEKVTSLSSQVILLYGRPKIGKSTICSYFPDAIFLATEAGLNHLEVFKVNVNNWEKFLDVCKELAEGKHQFKTVVIDTLDNLISMCNEYICKINNVDHIGDIAHGKGWSKVTTEVMRVLTKLSLLPYGLVMVAHCKQEEIETKVKKYNRWTINCGGKTQDAILAMPDIILFMDSEVRTDGEFGVIRTKPSMYFEAGDKSKLLPETIEFALNNPKIAYDKIVECFNKK